MKCEICHQECKSNISFVKHLKNKHDIESQEYYDTYLKKDNEGVCNTCETPTKYISISKGYAKYCSAECSKSWDTRKENFKSFEKEHNCSKESYLIEKYGKSPLTGIPRIKFKGTKFISNTFIDSIEKTYDEYAYACKICAKKFKSNELLSSHIYKTHNMSSEEYYNLYLRKSANDGICISCGKPTKFYGLEQGYKKHCSRECNNKDLEFRSKVSKTISSDDWQDAYKRKMMEKYGVDSYSKTPEFKNKVKTTFHSNIEKFEEENNCTLLWKLIEEYGQGWYNQGIGHRIKHGFNVFILNDDIELIKKYSSENHQSTFEVDIVEYIKSIYSGEVIIQSRKIIPPLELDIYIPEKHLAIEVNGLHWHSTNSGTPKNYHLNKTKLCEDLGIRLIHIFDIEWVNHKDILKSMIASALGIYDRKIYARNCVVKEVSSTETKQFLETNHIQGSVNSSYRLGLFYKDKLVQLITIGKSRFKTGEYELLRMCTKLNTQVIGGFSKLLQHQPYNNLISFIDRSKFSGKAYLQSGWSIVEYTQPSYFYFRRDVGKLNRLSAQKHKLEKLLGSSNFDASKTEIQNMIDNGFYQVYDCGNVKVRYTS